ncbi:serine-rich adhesin for platelets-like isoform X3 [Epinephelus moara]|uniref:serine-rich adhesin for platelets-like isoform X3 n=1 Tax=Epinephelus moara TaxID=300413 RepID=UPI00214EAF6D|nr:serine-rich adhesin for platelets-like isoform X3 [Epinephelus moara]
MRSGFPHSQGGAYSAFQCRSNVDVLPSPQDISTAPVPVVQPENGIQNNMVATQYPGELRVAHTPAKLQPGYAQSQQNFQELHHHQESQANKVSTGLQHPLPTDSKYTSWNSHHQISREDNAVFHTSVHVSKQRSSYFGTLVNENSVRQSVYNGGKQRECHRQNFSRHSLKGSNLNKNPGLRQRHLNSASSASTIATESCPLLTALQKGNDSDSKYSTTSSSSSEETNANSEVITITNLSDGRHCKAQQVKGSSLKCGWTRTQNLDNSGGTPSTPHQQQVMFPSPSSQSSTENVHPVRKTKPPTDDDILDFVHKSIAEYQTILTQKNRKYEHSNKDSDRVYSPQPDSIMPKVDSVAHLPTTSAPDKEDVEWQSLNCAVTAAVGQELEEDSSKGSKTNAEFTKRVEETGDCATSASERHSTEYQQIMREVAFTCTKNEDESRVVLTSMPGMTQDDLTEKQTSLTLNCSMSQEQNNSLWSNSKDLDTKVEVPDDRERYMPERQSGALKLVEAEGLDSVQSITDISEDLQTKSTSVAPKNKTFQSTSLSKNLIANTKKNKSIDDQQHCGVTSKKATAHSKLNSSLDKTQIQNVVSIPMNHSEWLSTQTSCEDLGEDTGCVDSQTDLSMSLSEAKKHAPPYESEGEEAFSTDTVKNPLYEDISDNDMPQLDTKLPNLEHWEVSSLACSENPIYEYISEDESQQIEYISGETSSPTQAPEPNVKQSPFENEAYGLVQGQALMTTDIISDEELIPKKQVSPEIEALIVAQQYSNTDPGFEGRLCPKYDSEQQENHSISCSPYPILKDGEETDDEMDDDWLIIPIVVSDLNFEAHEQDQDSPQENVLDVWETGEQERQCDTSPTHWPSPNPEASAFSPLEIFDTLATLQQKTAMKIKTVVELALRRSTPEREMDSEGEPLTPQSRRESVDSCETEDSLDYSPELERNFMTVSKKLLESSAPLPLETDVVVSAKEGVSSEVTNMQKVQTSCFNKSSSLQRLGELIKVKAASKRVHPKTNGKKISKKDEIFISGSDSEDECDQYCKKKAKRKRFFSSSSDDSEDAGNSWCETVEKKFQNNSLPSRDLPAQQHQWIRDSSFAGLSHSTEECVQMIGTKAPSEHVQHNGQNVSKEEIITIHDTDSEDDSYQSYKKTSRKSYFSLGSDSDDNSCVEETRKTSRTEDSECETAEEETQLSFADSALLQHPSKLYVTQYEEVMQDACSDVSHSVKKSGQLIEANGEREHVQNTTNRQRTLKRRVTFCDSDKVVKKSCFSQKKANTQDLLLSESEDIGDDLVSAKNRPSTETVGHLCRTGNAQPHKNRLSSKDSPEKQCQSADKESNSTLDPNHLIPRFLLVKPSQPAERIHKQDEKGTLPPKISTVFSKKPDICEKNTPHLYRNKQGRFVPKPQPENDKHHAKENNIQAKVPKSRTVSRQLPLPSQDSPSTSLRSLPSTSGQLSEARQRLAYSRNMSLPGETTSSSSATSSKQSSSIPTQHLSSPKLHRSHSTSSTLNLCTNTKGPSFSEKSLRARLVKGWKEGYTPVHFRTRRNGKTSLGMKEDLRTLNNSLREVRPGPSHRDKIPKQRHNSHKTTPLLMKRSRTEAIQRTNDIHRDPTVKLKGFVGKNYKWKNGDKANERIELDWEDK